MSLQLDEFDVEGGIVLLPSVEAQRHPGASSPRQLKVSQNSTECRGMDSSSNNF
jgi:hypothetical protein